jgi:hypothetical protein
MAKRKSKQRGRGNILLTDEQDNAICTAIENYCTLSNDEPMKKCIDEALKFFTGSPLHIKIFNEVLSNPRGNKVRFCMDNYISEPQFYIYRREIVWRVAMVCYAMDIFSI